MNGIFTGLNQEADSGQSDQSSHHKKVEVRG
jgi:hypothetical protein